MSYAVRLLPAAKADLHEFYNYIAERSPEGADHWEAALEAGLARLRQNPFQCGLAPEHNKLGRELRQLLFRTQHGHTYRAVYLVEGEEVFVLRLRGPGQKPLRARDMPNG